jgi:hypothetical protein
MVIRNRLCQRIAALLGTSAALLCPVTLLGTSAAASVPSPAPCVADESEGCASAQVASDENEEEAEENGEAAREEDAQAADEPSEEGDSQQSTGAAARGSSQSQRIRLSGLSLTPRSAAALHHGHVKASAIAFSFATSASGTVQVLLKKQTTSHRQSHWRSVSKPQALAAHSGRDQLRLNAHRQLSAGLYRLTLVPHSGGPASITLHVRA